MTSRRDAGAARWEPDVLPGYWQRTLPLGPDPHGEGDLVATLVRRGEARRVQHAVVALHGYTDYFFNTELADHFAARGFAVYALDLHKCGRSRADGQTPHFTTDLANYDAELARALAVVAEDTGGAKVCMYGHSAGGLIATLWLDRARKQAASAVTNVGGLVLNSPFFDLQGPAILRSVPTSAALIALGRWRKLHVVRKPTEGGYGTTLHRDYAGDFDYNLDWKPLGGFPVTFGWINAIRRGHARLHRGLDVGVPNVILRSDHSVREAPNPEAIHRGDAVLDVTQIARWAGCVGNRTTIAPIVDAKHDVFLSLPEPRASAYRELDAWLDYYLKTDSTTRTGRELTRMEHYDLTIIGTGSGNSIPDPSVDPRYGDMRIAICEQGTFGGTCLNVGCIPTKMFVYAAEVAETIKASSRFGIDSTIDKVRWPDIVERVFGRIDPIAAGGEQYKRGLPNVAVFASHTRFGPTQPDGRYTLRTDAGDEFTSDKVVIAAGSRIRIPPAITKCGVAYETSDTIMRIPALPEHLVIVGGGFVAAEFAHVFSSLGVRISIVVRGDGLLTHCDESICYPFTELARDKWDLHTHENVIGSHHDGEQIVLELDDGKTLSADMLLVATGRIANGDLLDAELAGVEVNADGMVVVDDYQRTTARGIYALGDVSSAYQLKHVANHEMRVVRHNLLVDWDDTAAMVASDHRFVPSAVFTDPQIATVGLTEEEARAAGYDVSVKVQNYGDTAYGWAMEDQTGVAKVIGDRATGKILGAHFMGYQASSLIQPIIQAMSFGQTAKEVATGQYWIHPALAEVVENALLGLEG